jgi:hypothetical protein
VPKEWHQLWQLKIQPHPHHWQKFPPIHADEIANYFRFTNGLISANLFFNLNLVLMKLVRKPVMFIMHYFHLLLSIVDNFFE